MRYTLLYAPTLSVFVLIGPDGQRETYTEADLLAKFSGNELLCQWAEFTKVNAGKYVDYDLLPA